MTWSHVYKPGKKLQICIINVCMYVRVCMLSPSVVSDPERVTGRKARGLQMEDICCKCQTLLSLLSSRRKQTGDNFFPSLYKL